MCRETGLRQVTVLQAMLADTVCIMAVTLTTLDGVGPAHVYALAVKSWSLVSVAL
jgi:hypothetical protein